MPRRDPPNSYLPNWPLGPLSKSRNPVEEQSAVLTAEIAWQITTARHQDSERDRAAAKRLPERLGLEDMVIVSGDQPRVLSAISTGPVVTAQTGVQLFQVCLHPALGLARVDTAPVDQLCLGVSHP